MRNIDSELTKAGAEFRNAGQTLPDQQWGNGAAWWRPGRPLFVVAVTAAAVLLLAVPILLLGGGGGSGTPGPVGDATETSTQAPQETTTTESVATPPVAALLADPPHLLIEADGWTMVYYYENSVDPYLSDAPLIFRPAGGVLGETTFLVHVFEPSDAFGWDAGDDAERIELEGRVVSIVADTGSPHAQGAIAEFDNGTRVVVQGFDMDRPGIVDVVTQITLDTAGDPVVVPPSGYEPVAVSAPYAETVTYREAVFEGPDGANADLRIWSGTMADVELQVLNRIQEAQSVRSTTIDGAAAAIAHHSDSMSRVWVVGGADGYVIEIDFNPFIVGASDTDLDAVLSQVHLVDLVTFEAALPEGSVTSATMDTVVAEMLADIPQPAGFDPATIDSTGARYQVGAAVVGAVTCAWLDQWVDATAAGDTESAEAAVAALGTSTGWSILLEMDEEGGYPEVVWEYAEAIAHDGTVVGGRVLTVEESYESAFGCG